MPKEKLETLKRINDYILVAHGEKATMLGEDYEKFVLDMSNFKELLDGFYHQNEEGNYPTITRDDLLQLQNGYMNLLDQSRRLMQKNSTNVEKRMAYVAQQVHNMLAQDFEIISTINVDEIKSLPETLHEARIHKYELGNANPVKINHNEVEVIPFVFLDSKDNQKKVLLTKVNLDPNTQEGIESKNYATSQIATLLGNNDLIARSNLAEIEIGGQKGLYNVMVYRRLSDPSKPIEGEAGIKWAQNGAAEFSYNAIKQCFDLDVIDYITGASKKHDPGFKFDFDNEDPDHPVLENIVADENAESFLTNEELAKAPFATKLDDIRYISKSMSEKVMSMTKEQLSFMLKDAKLSQESIDAAWDRVSALQNKIKNSAEAYRNKDIDVNKPEPGLLFAMSEDDIEKLELANICLDNDHNTALRAAYRAGGNYLASEALKKDEEEIQFNEGRLARKPREDGFIKIQNRVGDFIAALEANDPLLHINSPSFRKMKNKLNALSDKLYEVRNEDEAKEIYQQLADASRAYIEAKGTLPSSQFGKNRLEIARQLRDFADERLEEFKDPEYKMAANLRAHYEDFVDTMKCYEYHIREYNRLDRYVKESVLNKLAVIGRIDEKNALSKLAPTVRNYLADMIYMKSLQAEGKDFDYFMRRDIKSQFVKDIKESESFKQFFNKFDFTQFAKEDINNLDGVQLHDKVYKEFLDRVKEVESKQPAKQNVEKVEEKESLQIGDDGSFIKK